MDNRETGTPLTRDPSGKCQTRRQNCLGEGRGVGSAGRIEWEHPPQNGPVLQKPLKATSSTCLPCLPTYAGPCGTFESSPLVALNPLLFPYCHLDLSSLPSGLYVPRVQAFPVPEGTTSAAHQSLVLGTAGARGHRSTWRSSPTGTKVREEVS